MPKTVAVLLAALAAIPAPARAQAPEPAGAEFRVNSVTAGVQDVPAVAVARDGRFLAVWRTIGANSDVAGQLYDARGNAVGGEFLVHAATAGDQFPGGVAAIRDRGYVVVWSGSDGGGLGVFARRLAASAQPLDTEFRVNEAIPGDQVVRAVAAAPDGGFVVVWDGAMLAGGSSVYARRFTPDGRARGPEFQVSEADGSLHLDGAVATFADGGFVATWTSAEVSGPSRGIFGRRFSAGGDPVGAQFQVTTSASGQPITSAVATAAGGGFVVLWSGPDGSSRGTRGQRYDADGQRRGPEFAVNAHTTDEQVGPSVAATDDGGFTATWSSLAQDGSSWGIFARRFGRSGLPRGPEFRVNAYTLGAQTTATVSSDAAGNLVAVWQSQPHDTDAFGVYGQRYGGLRPVGMAVDGGPGPKSNGNGVLEACETAVAAPSWRNDSGAVQSVSSGAGSFTGPAGAGYTIADATADYGAVADGAVAGCALGGDCFVLTVSCVTSRPAPHWDAALVEEIVPAAQGQVQRWPVHLGDSFSDVPRGSGFYRFVETILHHGITGGCGGTSYCPAQATTREQMAVFVLIAREGPGYTPPPCTTPMFGDVPAASPFCPWIEELARRGVAGGCGGGNFCPGAPVSREQMSVFVLRTLDPALDPPACTSPMFPDVPAASPFCRWIEELARRGAVAGCGGGNYCPTAPVTREQMAAFLTAGFGLALYGP